MNQLTEEQLKGLEENGIELICRDMEVSDTDDFTDHTKEFVVYRYQGEFISSWGKNHIYAQEIPLPEDNTRDIQKKCESLGYPHIFMKASGSWIACREGPIPAEKGGRFFIWSAYFKILEPVHYYGKWEDSYKGPEE